MIYTFLGGNLGLKTFVVVVVVVVVFMNKPLRE